MRPKGPIATFKYRLLSISSLGSIPVVYMIIIDYLLSKHLLGVLIGARYSAKQEETKIDKTCYLP